MASGGAIGIGSTRPLHTWISASVVRQLAVLDVKTVVIEFTLQVRNTDAIRTRHEARGTDTLGAIVREHQTSAGVTDALVTDEDKAELSGTSLTHALTVGVVTRGADTLLPLVEDEASARGAGGHRGALHGGVALVALDADADPRQRPRVAHTHSQHNDLDLRHRVPRAARAEASRPAVGVSPTDLS